MFPLLDHNWVPSEKNPHLQSKFKQEYLRESKEILYSDLNGVILESRMIESWLFIDINTIDNVTIFTLQADIMIQ